MKLFTTILDEEIHKKIKDISLSTGKKIKSLVEEALNDLIKKYGDS